ncbi:MAG: Tex family protein [Planctomycetota bacterium]|nr:Tex family protein [Planctomycetota bacterium]
MDVTSELAAHVPQVVTELNLTARQVIATVELLDEGSTVPFIARYRKEVTGGLDEVAVIAIRDRFAQLRELADRRAAVLKSLTEQGKLTDALNAAVMGAATMSALEDIYLPYRPKRRTRGTIAREKGLEPLAKVLFEQDATDPDSAAAAYIDPAKEVPDVAAALAGARDIIAEWVNEDAAARAEIRRLFAAKGILKTRVIPGKETEGAKFKDYFDWSEPIAAAPSHRVLAIRRGEHEKVLTFDIQPDPAEAVGALLRRFVRGESPAARQVKAAVEDSYKRLMAPSIETDIRLESKKRADEEAIRVFAENIRELLLSSPLGQKRVLAVDPGLRTGCKIVVLDEQGKLLHHDVIFPLEPMNRRDDAGAMVKFLCQRYRIEALAVGNGTGGREAEAFCRDLGLGEAVAVVSVNESGASVYSASEVAREEFPDQDLTVRGAVSIGRRLMDPLAELVKIDPKSIGVGQYQHDVDQPALKRSLDDTVGSCVNAVGVELNTASKELLGYVSGLSSRLAGAIVAHRNANGAFVSRSALLDVPGMGPKTFEQAAGFLRIRQSPNPLDASAVHPERYGLVETMAADVGCSVAELIADPARRERIDVKKYVTADVGAPTLNDIMAELAKPGRDPRKQFEAFQFADGVRTIADLLPGMKLPGIVTNVAAFGAFVDIGVHQDGLIHVSELADRFVKNPSEVVKVLQHVTVTVMSVDAQRKRISLSMRTNPGDRPAAGASESSPPRAVGAKRPTPPRPAPPAGGWFTDLLKDKPKPKTP